MKNHKILKNLFAIIILSATNASFAQGFGDDVVDNPPLTSINSELWILILLGFVYSFYLLGRNCQIKKLD